MSVCDIVDTGQSIRLPNQSDEVTITCPTCGHGWKTTERNGRRIRAGQFPATCRACRRPDTKVTETHRRYWLILFGCDLRGRSAAEYVRQEGLPAELQVMCAGLDGFFPAVEAAA